MEELAKPYNEGDLLNSVRPVTVKQALSARQIHEDAPFTLDGQPVGTVCCIVYVKSLREQDRAYILEAEDGSCGLLRLYLNKEENEYSVELLKNEVIRIGIYVRVHGKLFGGRRASTNMLIVKDLAPVGPDFHEIFYHLLRCIYVTKDLEMHGDRSGKTDGEAGVQIHVIEGLEQQKRINDSAGGVEEMDISNLSISSPKEEEQPPSDSPLQPADAPSQLDNEDARSDLTYVNNDEAGDDDDDDDNDNDNDSEDVDGVIRTYVDRASQCSEIDASESADADEHAIPDTDCRTSTGAHEGNGSSGGSEVASRRRNNIVHFHYKTTAPGLASGSESDRNSESHAGSAMPNGSPGKQHKPASQPEGVQSMGKSKGKRDPLSGLSKLEREVVLYILNKCSDLMNGDETWEGVDVIDIARYLQLRHGRITAYELMTALDNLIDGGQICTTIDESHYDVSTGF